MTGLAAAWITVKERRAQFAHGRPLQKRDLSDLLLDKSESLFNSFAHKK